MFNFLKNSAPYFASTQENIFDYYFTIDESLDVLEKLLLYQLGSNENIQTFLTDLLNVCDKIIPKVNCFEVVSPI